MCGSNQVFARLFSDPQCLTPISNEVRVTTGEQKIQTHDLGQAHHKFYAKQWVGEFHSPCSTESVNFQTF